MCFMMVSHANASYAHYPFPFFPMPPLPINQFHLNVSGVGCPKAGN